MTADHDVRYHSSDDMAGLHELADTRMGGSEPVAVVIRSDGSVDVYGYVGVVDQRSTTRGADHTSTEAETPAEGWVRKKALAFFAANVQDAAGDSFDLPDGLTVDGASEIATRLYHEVRDVGAMTQHIHQVRLACPTCGSTDLDTLEVASCVAECDCITTEGPQFSGTTDYDRGDQTTVGVICNNCQWTYEADDWLEKLVPEAPVEASPAEEN